METLKGGRPIRVTLESGETEEIIVRQIPLRDYEKGFNFVDDEMALVAICVERKIDDEKPLAIGTKQWIEGLTPESYEAVQAIAQEVNEKGFFAFCQRKQTKLYSRLNGVSPEILKLASEKVLKASPHVLQPQRG